MLSDLRLISLLTAAAGVAMLLAAFGFQHIGGLDPCVLCVYQRWPWVAVAMLGAAAVFLGGNRAIMGLSVLVLLAGAGIAAYHVGVEQHWWAGTAECGGQTGAAQSVADLKRQLLATEVTRCDEVAWSLLGISMAGYNMILSAGLAVVLVLSLIHSRRRPR